MIEEFYEALLTIGNHKEVKRICEPNIFCPQELKSWMVKRTIKALELFEDELYKDTRRPLPETPISDEGSICSDT